VITVAVLEVIMSKEIDLTRGLKATVDDDDYDMLNKMSWYAQKDSRGKLYAATDVLGDTVYMHRLITKQEGGDSNKVDHISGNTLDNRKENLRITSTSENAMNNKKTNAPRTSKYKGVTKQPDGRWRAMIGKDNKDIHIGYYDDEDTAAQAYDTKARELFGDKARLNFPGKI